MAYTGWQYCNYAMRRAFATFDRYCIGLFSELFIPLTPAQSSTERFNSRELNYTKQNAFIVSAKCLIKGMHGMPQGAWGNLFTIGQLVAFDISVKIGQMVRFIIINLGSLVYGLQ